MTRAITLVLAAATLLPSTAAWACGQPVPCPALIPADGARVPANLPAVWVGRCPDGGPAIRPELLGPEGPVDVDAEPWDDGVLLRLRAPLVEGATYELRSNIESGLDGPCACDGRPTPVSRFVPGPPADLPSRIRVRAGAPAIRALSVPTSSGSCTSSEELLAADLAVHPDPDVAAFEALVRSRVRVEEEYRWCGTRFGKCDGVTLVASCPALRDPRVWVLEPGLYRVYVEAWIVGGPTLGPGVVDVKLCCSEEDCPDRRVSPAQLRPWTDRIGAPLIPLAPDDGTSPPEDPPELGGSGGGHVGAGGDHVGGAGGTSTAIGGAGGDAGAGLAGGGSGRAGTSAPARGCGCTGAGEARAFVLVLIAACPALWRRRRGGAASPASSLRPAPQSSSPAERKIHG